MAHLTTDQIITYAYQAGFRGADLVRATAVALAESSGNTNARNTTGGNDARGLMQINVGPRANPGYASRNLYDPAINMATAKEMQSRSGWAPWNSSRAGQLLYTPGAAAAVAQLSPILIGGSAGQAATQAAGNAAKNAVGAATGGLSEIGQAASKVGAWITTPANWLRVIYVIVGGILVVGAIIVIARPVVEPAVKTTAKTAALIAA